MKTKTKYIIGIISFILFMILVAIGYQYLSMKYANLLGHNKKQQHVKAEQFTVYTEKEEPVTLSQLQGKPVILNFWATWCGFCKEEMPAFEELYQKEGTDIHFMMINATDGERETKEKAEQYIKENHFTFPVYYDIEVKTVEQYRINSFPITFFIDKKGNIIKKHIGRITKEILEKEIQNLKEEEKW